MGKYTGTPNPWTPKTNVDLSRLAKIFGLKEWPEWARPRNEHQNYALRVLTDAHTPCGICGQDEKIHPDIVVKNATHWIELAFAEGQRYGEQLERMRWQDKLRNMFDLPTVQDNERGRK